VIDSFPNAWCSHSSIDIIGLLIVGIIFIALFLLWQGYLEAVRNANNDDGSVPSTGHSLLPTPPPLMPLSLWARAKGRVSVVMWIGFLLWASFLSWNYWALVSICPSLWVEADPK
jgi:hypothetical protein